MTNKKIAHLEMFVIEEGDVGVLADHNLRQRQFAALEGKGGEKNIKTIWCSGGKRGEKKYLKNYQI